MTAALTLIALPRCAPGAEIETLLMPGEVIEGHAEFESECSKCHTRFSKRSQTRLCRDCHDKVDADIDAGRGFHGFGDKTEVANCKTCHSEHLGRGADIVRFNPATFDHRHTDFALRGAHRLLSCRNCHAADEKYRDAPASCKSCHGEQEPHKGKLGDDCASCHTQKRWQTIEFDHSTTEYELTGKHTQAACNACHINERYEDTPQACNSCHALEDVHGGANGPRCDECHNTRDWKKAEFDHDRETDFPLRGKHSEVRCNACHRQPAAEKSPGTECIDCHRNDDAHHGRFGKQCRSCHTPADWSRSRFDHNRDTDFSLKGKHAELICSSCHRGTLNNDELSVECFSCHSIDDVHRGQEGEKCERCHQSTAWGDNIVFDHDLTRFPLLGLHATTPCEECHLSATFQDAKSGCIDCHRDDDVHDNGLGSDCRQCHNPNAWTAWLFDHDSQTDFALDGAHGDLTCVDCHSGHSGRGARLSGQCRSCHKLDDIHEGRFGSDCARCHTTGSFQDVQIN